MIATAARSESTAAGGVLGGFCRRLVASPVPLPRTYADQLRRRTGVGHDESFDIVRAVVERGWRVDVRPLLGESSGLQAALLPSRQCEFNFVVDPRPASTDLWEESHRGPKSLSDAIVRFRLAHELAHTLFYERAPTSAPFRTTPPTEDEERFCDAFASELLVPEIAAREALLGGADALCEAALLFRAPISVVVDRAHPCESAAGLARADDGCLELVGPAVTRNLADSWLLWSQKPDLQRRLAEVARASNRTVSFLAVFRADGDMSLRTSIVPD